MTDDEDVERFQNKVNEEMDRIRKMSDKELAEFIEDQERILFFARMLVVRKRIG